MSEEMIEPCPFCGGPAYSSFIGNDLPTGRVNCAHCDAEIEARTEAEAIAAWNKRSAHNPNERLREALAECATALHAFICLIDVDGLGQEFWTRAPHHEEAQHAMAANNEARDALSALSPLPSGRGYLSNDLASKVEQLSSRKYDFETPVAAVLRAHYPSGMTGYDWSDKEAFDQAIALVRLGPEIAKALRSSHHPRDPDNG